MPIGRWLVLVLFILFSLSATVVTLTTGIPTSPRGQVFGFGLYYWLQLQEFAIAYGLITLNDWSIRWGLRWYSIKAIYTLGVIGGCC